MKNITSLTTRFFPIFLVLFSAGAFLHPEAFTSLGPFVPYLLGFVMLTMGLTLTPLDFSLVMTRPKDIIAGLVLRSLIMPLAGAGVAWLLDLPPALGAGLILVGCCPSGTAANVITYVGKGDTALAVTTTSVGTLLAPLVTPYCFLLLAGSLIPIEAAPLIKNILTMVMLPVIAGICLRVFTPRLVTFVLPAVPLISIASITFIVCVVVALSASRLADVALIAFCAVALHNLAGMALGYAAAKGLRLAPRTIKAITFQVGMENSGLAVALALAHLDPLAAIPGAIFSVWQNVSGSLLASRWGREEIK